MEYSPNGQKTVAPIVSFVVLAKDSAAERLVSCINSIRNLSLRNDEREIFVVDDGSDTSLVSGLPDAIQDVVFVRQPRSGVEAAMDLGLRLATGRYVQFVFSADTLLLDGYGHCLDIIRYKSPDMVIFKLSYGKEPSLDFDDTEIDGGADYLLHNTIDSRPWGYAFDRKLVLGREYSVKTFSSFEEFTVLLLLKSQLVLSTSAPACLCSRLAAQEKNKTGKREMLKRLDAQFGIIRRLNELSYKLPVSERCAIERRVAELTMDYIISVAVDARFSNQLKNRIAELERLALFPLPDRKYGKKYYLFSKLTKNRFVRSALIRLLSL